jgi:hypothetical protein
VYGRLASIFDNGKIARTRKQVKTKNYRLKETFFPRLVRMFSGAEDPLFIIETPSKYHFETISQQPTSLSLLLGMLN